jgi:thiol-disulfide isomerase/thioredoxin
LLAELAIALRVTEPTIESMACTYLYKAKGYCQEGGYSLESQCSLSIKPKTTMKVFLMVFIGLCMLSCKNEEVSNTDFEFVITGKVNNAEGVKIALIPEGSSTEDRLVAVIKDGVFTFKDTSDMIKSATLRFEDDIVQMKGSYASSLLLLEAGQINMSFDIGGDEGRYRLSMPTFEKGDKNKELLSFADAFKSAVGGGSMVFGDSVKNDSMVRLVYPKSRENVLNLFGAQFDNGTPAVSSFLFSEIIIRRLNSSGMFDKQNMEVEDVKRVSRLFYHVDSTTVSIDKYDLMKNAVFQLNSNSALRPFVEFISSDAENVDFTMSSLLRENEYTLLYFWFTECKPCRTFNREMKYNYSILQSKGIEVIGVNVDDSSAKWQKSSTQDDIQWRNLYVGDNSGVETKYGIRGFPFKVLFDKDLKNVDVDIKSVEDVMSWANSK